MSTSSDRHLKSATRFIATGLLALAAGCSPAFAQDSETWRCEAPHGSYRTNDSPISDRITSISGRISFHKAFDGPEFGSVARIGFKDSRLHGSECQCNGLLLQALHNPDAIGFYMTVNGEEVELSGRTFDTPITFKISIDPDGVMTVKVGKDHLDIKSAPLHHPGHDTMTMSCSGADISFLNIDAR